MEELKSADGKTVAIVIKKTFKKDGINFVSKSDYPLQVGINRYVEGSKIKPHMHIDKEVIINNLQEVLYIKNGKVIVNLYNPNKELFKSFKLSTGDLIFFVSGGHGLEMLKNTVIIEVKQGPYFGKNQDKIMLE